MDIVLGKILIGLVVGVAIFTESMGQEPATVGTNAVSSGRLLNNAQSLLLTRVFFGKEYAFASSETLAVDGTKIEKLRYERADVQEFGDEFAVVLLLHGNSTTQTIAIPTVYGGDTKLLKVPEPILAVSAPLGGNGWKMSPHHVLSLRPDHFLEKIGQVDWVIGNDLSDVDATFESNPWIGHAGAPYAQTFYKVENGKLLVDKERDQLSWSRIIEQSTQEIERAAKASAGKTAEPKLVDNPVLHSILVRLLCYRLQGKLDEGQKATEQDLVRCFGKESAEQVIEEIKKLMSRKN